MKKYHKRELAEYQDQSHKAKEARPRALGLILKKADTAKARKITAEKLEHVNMLLARWIATHFRPLVLIEDEGFLDFVSYTTFNLVLHYVTEEFKLRIGQLEMHALLDLEKNSMETMRGWSCGIDVWNKLSKPKHKEWLAIDCICALLKPFGTVSTTLGVEGFPILPLIMSALHAVDGVLENKHIYDCKLDGAGSKTYMDEIRVLMVEVQKIILRVFKHRFDKWNTTNLD
ncbi:hypothetical protein PHMEG_00021061 [Phytophthora megakarya]|uniref:Uncharacterized protein n=1 Tax=Phytophthora megakarya TaxID=4795 RepID=A0A225VMB6_9STRA|nr:hypothetical protein PHMEG_00021061 [Phytophthora megakarya]